jgi:hypothetical protein
MTITTGYIDKMSAEDQSKEQAREPEKSQK